MGDLINIVNPSEWSQIFSLADAVQKSVEDGRWAYLAVISIFILIECNKKLLAKKFPSVKKNAAQYSAGLGATVGALLSDDPMTGAIGGMMVGNAASGLSSVLKPVMSGGILGMIPLVLKIANYTFKSLSGTTKAQKEQAVKDLDKAIESSKGKEASTKELEKWYKKNT